jgi:hypothetical protein
LGQLTGKDELRKVCRCQYKRRRFLSQRLADGVAASFFKGKTIPEEMVVLGSGRIDDLTVSDFISQILLPGQSFCF